VKGLDKAAMEQAQLGLGHSYSRRKAKFNPARSDNMIIQSIALLDQMDKDLNTFSMRIREWYSWHFPELKDLVKDMYMYARCTAYIQNKKVLSPLSNNDMETDKEDKLPGLIEIVQDKELAEAIVQAARKSMGMDCNEIDMLNIVNFSQRFIRLAEYKKKLAIYLHDKMLIVAPNLSTILGDVVAARLISKAGSLTNLAKVPASTVQILGAEKALFRALKTRGNTPKYGLIYHSTFIGRADSKNKGRISRYLANKCSIATRIDSFADEPTTAYGEKLREQVEERLKFYQTGAKPRKNIDVMNEVAQHLAAAGTSTPRKKDSMDIDPKKNKSSKKKKKRKLDSDEEEEAFITPQKSQKLTEEVVTPKSSSKKKKKKKHVDETDTPQEKKEVDSSKKKKKKKKEVK